MPNWMEKLWHRLTGLLSRDTLDLVWKGIVKAEPYLTTAINVATALAKATPNRSQGEILAAIQTFSAEVDFQPGDDPGETLRKVALAALKRIFPEAGAADLNRAIELAVGGLKK
ncbi:MAG: hypothetical protein ACM34G_17275 [Acidobacteriota bacterium]